MKVFISYSTKDAAIANQVLENLEKNQLPCFMAPRDIRSGYVYAEEIMYGIDACDMVVLILTENSNQSAHVLREIERAVSIGKPILTYRVKDNVKLTRAMEYFLMSNQWLDRPTNGDDSVLVSAINGVPVAASVQIKNKKSAKKYILGAVALLAVIIISVGVTVFVMKKKDGKAGETEAVQKQEYKVGETVSFGKYLDEDIEWIILNINDTEHTADLISKDVLMFKAFDGAESGKFYYTNDGTSVSYGVQFTPQMLKEAYGDNVWEKSNLRTWLNSDEAAVSYADTAPFAAALTEKGLNAYATSPGFLTGFSEAERNRIVGVMNETTAYEIDENAIWSIGETKEWDSFVVTEKQYNTLDFVYLPSMEDINKLRMLGLPIWAEPSDAAIAKEDHNFYDVYSIDYGVKNSYYWLRDVNDSGQHKVCCITNGYNEMETEGLSACVDGVGVRPMITVKVE